MGQQPDEPDDPPVSTDYTAPPPGWTRWRLSAQVPPHSKFTLKTQERFIGSVARTGSMEVAAKVAGVTSRSIRNWFTKARAELEAIDAALQADREPEPSPYAEFYLETQRALGWAQSRLINVVNLQADLGDWRAAAWLLERLGGKLAAEKLEVEHSGDSEAKDVVLSLEQKLDLIRERHAAARVPEEAE